MDAVEQEISNKLNIVVDVEIPGVKLTLTGSRAANRQPI